MEEKKDEEESTLNEGEAEVAMAHAKRLIQSGVQPSDIGIITPYAAQVKNILLLRLFKNRGLYDTASHLSKSSRDNV